MARKHRKTICEPVREHSVSVILPALNEEQALPCVLDRVRALDAKDVILVDGGSHDATASIAAGRVDRLIVQEGGLARQLNAGAAVATGDVLLFHYADVRLEAGALASIARALDDPRVVAGAFRLALDSSRCVFRFIAWAANLRNRTGFGPFGDQAIFVRRAVFEELGGFVPGAVLEDLDLVLRLRRRGRFCLLRDRAVSSVRRWEQGGVLRTSWAHFRVSVYYWLGLRKRAARLKGRLMTRR